MTKEELKNTAEQAAINIKEDEFETTHLKINNVLEYLSILDDYELRNITPSSHMTEGNNRWREDVTNPSISLKDALSNATRKNENFFKVPKVIE